MSLTPGTRIGPYEISAQIGAGGMGEVYRATDTNLARHVAIKVLPASMAADAERLARFDREAKTLAALNHPNIAAVYGLERSDRLTALVMELVEGPTLAERIAEGPIPLDEALAIASQIAEALEAAHEQSIIHRDLKPANIKLRPDGTVKVLDFGLAKVQPISTAGVDITASPTITSPAMTSVGIILGTAAYMSPEQARGQPVDKRADIWAFGCVFYEMLTGRRLFSGHTVTETLALVLTKEPDWSALPPTLAPAIRTALKRCLEHDRGKRIRDVAALRFVLDEAGNLTSSSTSDNAATPRRTDLLRPTMWMIAGAAIVAAVVGATGSFLKPVAIEKAFTFSILPPDGTTFVGTSGGGAPALSPDGRQISFVAAGSGGPLLWVQSIDAFDARPLPGTEGAVAPFWSPDGGWLGFRAGQSLKKVSVTGGQPQVLARSAITSLGAPSGSWNQAGTILFYGGLNNTLASVPAAGGESVQATERNIALFDENHLSPAFLPDGRHYLLLVRGGPDLQFQVWLGELGSNERRLLLKDVTNAQYAPPRSGGPGHVLYVRDGKLMSHPFDTTTQTFTGAAVTIVENVAVTGGGLADFSLSPSGVLAYRRGEPASEELALYDRAGKRVSGFGNRPGNPRNNVRVSPDGKWAAFTRQGDASQDVWIADLVRGGESRFTLDGGRSPVWAPDGSQIAFLRQESVYRKPFGNGGAEVVIWSGPGTLALNDWSGDGRHLLLTKWDTSKPGLTGRGLWLLPNPLDEVASHEPSLLQADALHGQFGPRNGSPRWVAFDAFDGTVRQLFVQTMPDGGGGKWQVTTNGGNTSRWRADGRELFILAGGSMLAVDIDSSSAFHSGSPHVLFATPAAFGVAAGQYAHGWDVTADGQRFLTTFPARDTPAPAINVVMNWERALPK